MSESTPTSRKLRLTSELFSYVVIIIGFLGLLGWILNVNVLKSPGTDFSTIKTNAAICFILIGFALWFSQEKRINTRNRRIAQILALIVALIGFLTFFEHFSSVNLGLDQLLFKEVPGALNTSNPNRMGFPGSINFVLVGLAVIFLNRKIVNYQRWSQYLVLIVGFITILALVGYAYNVSSLYYFANVTGIAIYAAIGFLLLFFGVLICRPDVGLMRTFNTDLLGGRLGPRVFLPTILITVILGWFLVVAINMGFISGSFAISLLVISTIIISFILIWLFAIRLNLFDVEIRDTNMKLKESKDHLEDEVKIRTTELSRSNDDLKQFAYVASHDLREPLRMITSFLQLLERRYKDQLDQDANEFIDYAVEGAKRLDLMIMDLLEYSRVSNKEIQFTEVNLEEVINQIMSNLSVLIEENNAQITYDSLPIILSDENQMLILLQNLISNAIKYRQEETPQIHVSAEKEDKQWLFSVKDNGIGIDPPHLERIFTIFQRLHGHEEYGGSGIGLSIVQRIVHQHGGEVWAESELGEGSTFYFTIPYAT